MGHDYLALAERRLTEMYEDASVRRSSPPKPRHFLLLRQAAGGALVRWGERMVDPAGSSAVHR